MRMDQKATQSAVGNICGKLRAMHGKVSLLLAAEGTTDPDTLHGIHEGLMDLEEGVEDCLKLICSVGYDEEQTI